MTIAVPEDLRPIWTGDSATLAWGQIVGTDHYDRLLEWLEREGGDPMRVHRVEVYLLDVPFAKVWEYVIDADGLPKVNEAGDDAESTARTVLLSSLPPMK